MTENDLLIALMEENRKLDHDAEQRRMSVAHLSIAVALIASGIIAFAGFHANTLPLAIIMLLTGIYGFLATAKLYERSQYHITRARKLRSRLNELYPDANVDELLKAAENEHSKRYSRLMKLRLNNMWLSVHVAIIALSVVYGCLCIW